MRVGCGYSERQPVSEVKSDPVLSIVLSAMSILVVDASAATSPERSVSPSEQFVIYGADAAWRGAVSDLAERTKADLLALLRRRDQWTIAAVINLQARAANLPEIPDSELRFSQTGSGLKIQLDLLITPEVDPAIVERELVRSILLEIAYRGLPLLPAGVSYATPPDWLINGISTLRDESPATLAALESLGAHPMPLKDLLAQRPDLLDSQSANLYRAHARALVSILTQHVGGRAQLQH